MNSIFQLYLFQLVSTYTQILYQIVFSTKFRERSLKKDGRKELYKYIAGLLKNKNCFVHQINGTEDHIHILIQLHPQMALSNLVMSIKQSSNKFIKEKNLFVNFGGWQNGYAAFTYSADAKENLIDYIQNQEEHHRNKTYKEELVELLELHQVAYNKEYLS